jgi:hypothetical protein
MGKVSPVSADVSETQRSDVVGLCCNVFWKAMEQNFNGYLRWKSIKRVSKSIELCIGGRSAHIAQQMYSNTPSELEANAKEM